MIPNGGSMPEEIAHWTRIAIGELSVPVGIHCHNDCELAVANSLAGIEAIFGLGRIGEAQTVSSTFGSDVYTNP